MPIYSTGLHKSSILASIVVYPKNEESAQCAFAASNSHFTQNIVSKRFKTKPQICQQISLIFKQKIYLHILPIKRFCKVHAEGCTYNISKDIGRYCLYLLLEYILRIIFALFSSLITCSEKIV